eukprot:TRINITY_DN8455_c1_g1_i1.p1 TRINITY_DN8455_c1_g1~~TRINITY_DN8455_c1_g1_i1.p1  ORF type:complete len:173 (+),score=16.99 TRINITY_DN8455_c1_g1_i1:93-611(+)
MSISSAFEVVKSHVLSRSAGNLLLSTGIIFGEMKLTPNNDLKWYSQLNKPKWNPPNWVFPAVWTPLKILQTISLWQLLQKGKKEDLVIPLALFGTHLALGTLWNVVFFNWYKMKESLYVMAAFWASLAGSIYAFYDVSKLSSYLLVPTQIWVTIAAKLNFDLARLNDGSKND